MDCLKEKVNPNETDNDLHQVDTNSINDFRPVCRIEANGKTGTGFLIKLYKDNKGFDCLMTNEHVITKQMIDLKQKITIIYDTGNKKIDILLNKDERYIKEYKNIDLDVTIVEVIKEDNIKEECFFFQYIEDYNFINKNIYIVQFPNDILSYSKGKIIRIDKYELTYNATTNSGSSGSPIFLENTKAVIGIHKQGNTKKPEKYGDLIYPIIIDLKPQLNFGNGQYYKGDIINNKAHGKGILYNKDENIKYEGDFIDDKFEGRGKYFYENGEYFIGEFKNNLKNGKGIEYYKNGDIKYEGDFIDDYREGNGKYNYENDDYYIGQFSFGLKHGKGIEYHKNGDIKR